MEIAALLKVIDVVMALVNSGFTFDVAFKKISDLITRRKSEGATEITDEDLLTVFDGTDAKIKAAREQFEKTLADSNTPSH